MYPSELAEAKSIFDKLNTFLQKQDILFIRRKDFSSLWFEVTLSWTSIFFYCFICCTRAYGYSSEDVQMVIESMASQGKEPTFCMGDDIPLAVLSTRPHMLFDYFKQRFAQVCNFH